MATSNANVEQLATEPPAVLRQFTEGDRDHPGFKFFRLYYQSKVGRMGIRPVIEGKLQLGDDPQFGKAAKHEVLLSSAAPGNFNRLDLLLSQFDAELPLFQKNVAIQVKIELDPGEGWHVGYERVRAYAREHLVSQGNPVILIAHIPGTAALSGNGPHVHCFALSRRLGINGFGEVNYALCSDQGHAEAWEAWKAHLAREDKA